MNKDILIDSMVIRIIRNAERRMQDKYNSSIRSRQIEALAYALAQELIEIHQNEKGDEENK